MRKIVVSTQFKKDVKLARKRQLPEQKLNEIVFKLANDEELPNELRDHQLYGDYVGFRELHIQPDWLLVYRKLEDQTIQMLNLYRTGSHSDLFGKKRR